MYDEPLPVVDHSRLGRVLQPPEPKRSLMTTVCLVFMCIGFLVLVKRYKDKQSRLQSKTQGTLQERGTHLFSSAS